MDESEILRKSLRRVQTAYRIAVSIVLSIK
jgi:hypothetical protein